MSFVQPHLAETRRLAQEVAALCAQALAELKGSDYSYLAYSNPKLSGELRRRSMDLTRALSRMRAS